MKRKVRLNTNEYFSFQTYVDKFPNIHNFVLTGARGCGKTYSVMQYIQNLTSQGGTVLYLRNNSRTLSTAKTYFTPLCIEGEEEISLGTMGAGSIVKKQFDPETHKLINKTVIGYRMAVGEYDSFKSSGKKVDFIVYEEFTSFDNIPGFNRVFSITEILESARQKNPDVYFCAIANNFTNDDVFAYIFDESKYLHVDITKPRGDYFTSNNEIQSYLDGEMLITTPVYQLSNYSCLGYLEINKTKIYLFENELKIPRVILAAKGTGKRLENNSEIANLALRGYYRSTQDRNKLEFAMGIVQRSNSSLRV